MKKRYIGLRVYDADSRYDDAVIDDYSIHEDDYVFYYDKEIKRIARVTMILEGYEDEIRPKPIERIVYKLSEDEFNDFCKNSRDYNGLYPEWRYCAIGNIINEHEYGVEKEIKSGTKQFRPGTKVYMAPCNWGDGYENVIVIGMARYSHKYIEVITRGEYITNLRCQKVFKPGIVKRMNLSKYTWWDNTDKAKEHIEKLCINWNM